MTIDWNAYTPWTSLGGGVLIGIAAATLILLDGRVAGISGIVGGLWKPGRGDIAWRIAFVLGLVAAPLSYGLVASLPRIRIDASFGALAVAGVLVGIGTRYGSDARAAMACAGSRASPRGHWLRRQRSWLPALSPSSFFVMSWTFEEPL